MNIIMDSVSCNYVYIFMNLWIVSVWYGLYADWLVCIVYELMIVYK